MRSVTMLQQSWQRLFSALIIAPMLYAVFVLVASTPARSQAGCQLVSCSFDEASCHLEAGTGWCCLVCYNYECPDGTTPSQCRTECGAQC